MFDTVSGLPLHALVVHAVVVLLPLAALGGILIAFVPKLRDRFGLLVGLAAVAAAVSVFVATQSGEQLEERVNATFGAGAASANEAQLMEEHTSIARNLLPWAIVLAVAVVALLALARYAAHSGTVAWLRYAGWAASAVTIGGAVLNLYWVIRIGEAGSRAAWTDVVDAGG